MVSHNLRINRLRLQNCSEPVLHLCNRAVSAGFYSKLNQFLAANVNTRRIRKYKFVVSD